MQFLWTTINVKNLDESVAFYRDIVGLKVKRRFAAGPGHELAFLGSEVTATEIELIRDEQGKPPSFGADISIGFAVDSLDRLIGVLKGKGIPVAAGPFQPNPAVKFLYILDPNGVRVQFVEQVR